MRTVEVHSPSFPDVHGNAPLRLEPARLWQVLCGDEGHWRAGVFSPEATCLEACPEFERHSCPELFLLVEGALTLALYQEGGVECLALEPLRPVLVTAPHCGFCPGGPHTGKAFVVERDAFRTGYATAGELRSAEQEAAPRPGSPKAWRFFDKKLR